MLGLAALDRVRCFLQDFTQGLADSLSVHRTIMFLIESPTVRVNTVKVGIPHLL